MLPFQKGLDSSEVSFEEESLTLEAFQEDGINLEEFKETQKFKEELTSTLA